MRFFVDKISNFKHQNWYLELESCSKAMEYKYLIDVSDGIGYLQLQYRDEASLVKPYFTILIKFYKWDDEKSDYNSCPSYINIIKTNADIYDFEENAKEFLTIKRKIAEITNKNYITFTDLIKKLKEDGVEFGI